MTIREKQPIAALATAPGSAAIAVIRMSGPDLAPLLRVHGLVISDYAPRHMHRAHFLSRTSGESIDDVLCVHFPAPHSYTGEGVVEIHTHGGPYIVRRVLEELYASGFRPADPGEFTRRAFLHGKLDLTQAEGIRELAFAQSEQEWRAARDLSDGHLRREIDSARAGFLEVLARLAARIDFPDEGDTADVSLQDVKDGADRLLRRLLTLQSSYRHGRIAREGLRVALVGIPNAGKSSLLNALLERDRALVTNIPGTTRDYIEEPCLMNGRLVRLIDTAGVRETGDPVEALGIAATRQMIEQADVVAVLFAADASANTYAQMRAFADGIAVDKRIDLLTKADVGKPKWSEGMIAISAQKGIGLQELRALLADRVDAQMEPIAESKVYITTARQKAAVDSALMHMQAFMESYQSGQFDECLAFELQKSLEALQSIIGHVSVDDILGEVFSTFCVGK